MNTKRLLILCSICVWLIGLTGCHDSPTEPTPEPTPTPAPTPLHQAFQSVCEEPGRGVSNAAAYTPYERPNKIVNETGGTFPNLAWNPSTVEETELVACRSPLKYVYAGTCAYSRYGVTVDCELPFQHKVLDIQVRTAQTAETIGTAAVEGNYRCPSSVPASKCYHGSTHTVYDSIDTSNASVAAVIRPFVE